ncbi:MAG: alkaline phosphatase family protein [Deltaproteobacteria bacterium]|nr:alkaline phosphatase family protein [Deltaproteobacteria bacterium]
MTRKRVIVLDVVGLSLKHFDNPEKIPHIAGLLGSGTLHRLVPPFPAVTLPVQATLTTGCLPEHHGVVANGFYYPETMQVSFWDQADRLVQAERIWERLRKKNGKLTTALLFMQNSLYADCKVVITPKPMHSEEGLIPWCYSKPAGWYEKVSRELGEFPLQHYWGPLAGIQSSRWIAGAAVKTMEKHKPDLMFVYLPHLDYCCQKFGPDSQEVTEELGKVDKEVGRIIAGVDQLGLLDETVFLVLSEYAFAKVEDAVPLNRILRQHDLLKVRTIQGREYLDIELSPAFAMVDHQVAHIYLKPGFTKKVGDVLGKEPGIDFLLQAGEEKKRYGINHQRCGEIVAVSRRDKWFSYYWWENEKKAPDFADKVDIHSKPGFDPLELFIEPKSFKISRDTRLIRGSHGYPPTGAADHVPLLISGRLEKEPPAAGPLAMTDVAGLIEEILGG